jgi:hypothetical protein
MKLKTLFIVVALLAVASIAVYFVRRPAPPASADPRVGQALLTTETVEKAAGLQLADAGKTVELAKDAEGSWRVVSFHDLPADFGKLSRFVKDLTDAKVERLVTSNPDTLARLGFSDTTLRLTGASGETLWSVVLGRTADGGGRFVRFADEQKAYRVRLSAWLDSTARNWADSALVGVKPEQIAKVEIGFGGNSDPVTVSREKADAPFTTSEAREGQQLRQSTLTSLLSTVANLRFTDTTAPDDADAVAARAHQRTLTLTTFDGATLTVALGRKPEQRVVKTPEPDAAKTGPAALVGSLTDQPKPEDGGPAKVAETVTETIPAGPVFAVVTGDPKLAKLAAANDRLAFKISDYNFTSLPQSPADLFEASAPPSPAPTSTEPADPGSAESAGQETAVSPPTP